MFNRGKVKENNVGVFRHVCYVLVKTALMILLGGAVSMLFADKISATDNWPSECDLIAYSYSWTEDGGSTYNYETAVIRTNGVYGEGYIQPGEKLLVFNGGSTWVFNATYSYRVGSVGDLTGIDKVARKTAEAVGCSKDSLGIALLTTSNYDANVSGSEVALIHSLSDNNFDIYEFDKLTYFKVHDRFATNNSSSYAETYITFTDPNAIAINHAHNYEWQTSRDATEDEDGEMIYVCKSCGDVKYRERISGYNIFNINLMNRIKNAGANSTVVVNTDKWISFHRMIIDTLATRPDLTLKINFLTEGYKGDKATVTIPPRADYASLIDKNGFTGFMFLTSKYGITYR